MDQFGVQIPRLKQIAAKPEFPVLINNTENNRKVTTIDFLNATIKSVEGLGESPLMDSLMKMAESF